MSKNQLTIEKVGDKSYLIADQETQWMFCSTVYVKNGEGKEILVSQKQINEKLQQLSDKIKDCRNTLRRASASEDEKRKAGEFIRHYRFCRRCLVLKNKDKHWRALHVG